MAIVTREGSPCIWRGLHNSGPYCWVFHPSRRLPSGAVSLGRPPWRLTPSPLYQHHSVAFLCSSHRSESTFLRAVSAHLVKSVLGRFCWATMFLRSHRRDLGGWKNQTTVKQRWEGGVSERHRLLHLSCRNHMPSGRVTSQCEVVPEWGLC